jgi:uncharacterized protein (TIGR02270 family)
LPIPAFIDEIDAPVLLGVVQLHVEEAAILRRQRTHLARAPHIRLHLLARHDERIVAHLDGVAVAGQSGRELVYQAALEPGLGPAFSAAAIALACGDHEALKRLLEMGESDADVWRGIASALGWTPAQDLRGVTRDLLQSRSPHSIALGLAACAMHGVDPGASLGAALASPDGGWRRVRWTSWLDWG